MTRARVLGVRVLAATGAVLAVLFAQIMADAAQPNDVIEQRWELLAETVTGQIGSTELDLPRGVLPAGTTKFDPQPTVTFEVVARLTAAADASSGYDVQLVDSAGAVLRSIEFRGSEATSFALKTGTFAWPSTDRVLSKIALVARGVAPGVLDIKKASLKIRQAGTVKKTVGRVPLGTRQAQITHTEWADIADPLIYRHVAADFDPAPVATLRVTGEQAHCGTFKVRLYDQTTSQEVSGSTLFFSSRTSRESSALTLVDGHRYKLQTEVDLGTCVGGTSAQSNDPGPGVPSGQVVSADLVLSQTTTDPDGLVKTVGWFPSVTAAVDFSSDAQNLGFKFTPPQLALPNPVAATWEATVRRTGPSGAAGTGMVNLNTASPASALATTTSAIYVDLSAGGVTLPAVTGQQLDTQTELASGAAGGRVASSLLRIVMSLRDLSAPQFLSALTASNPAFSPGVSIGSKDTTTLSATIKDFSPVTWVIEIRNASNQVVRTQSVSNVDARNGVVASWAWDGKNSSGLYVADGTYTATMSAVDVQGNSSSSPATPLSIVVDTVAPTISGYDAAPDPFSPNADGYLDTTTFSATLSESSTWSVQVGVATLPGSGTSVSALWNGSSVADGTHTGTLTATDAAGNSRVATTTVVRDAAGPTIASFAASNPDFSPGVSSGRKDTTVLTATVTDAWAPLDWVIEVKQGSTIVRSHSVSDVASPANVSWTWDGSDNAAQPVAEGTYSATLRATDEGRNSRTSSALTIRVDRTTPTLVNLTPADGHNTIYSSQPLQAEVIDQGTGASGISSVPSGVSFQLKNETTSATSSWSATYNAATKVATSSSSPTLTDGQDYTALVLAEDRAGNQIQEGHLAYRGAADVSSGGFRKITLQTPTASSTIPATSCTVQTEGLNKVAVCSGMQAQLGNSTVTVSSSRHSFVEAFVTHSMPLEDAVLDWKVSGSTVATINAYDARVPGSEWNPRSVEYRYAVGDRAMLPATLTSMPDDRYIPLGTLRITLPSSWAAATNVELRMSSATENPQPDACSSPLMPSVVCTTDPLWSHYTVFVSPSLSTTQRGAIVSQHEALGVESSRTYAKPSFALTYSPLYEGRIPPGIRSDVIGTAGVIDALPLRSDNVERRYRTLLHQLSPSSPSSDSDSISWSSAGGNVTQDLSLVPTQYSQLIMVEDFLDGSNDPTDGFGEIPAAAVTDTIEFRPNDATLLPDTAANAAARGRVRYQSNTGQYWVEVHPVDERGIRFVVWLAEETAPAMHRFDMRLPTGTSLQHTGDGSAVLVRDTATAADPPLAIFPPPVAYDANGLVVPVTQSITGTSIELQLNLTNADLRFPVLADPGASDISCQPATLDGETEDYLNVGLTYGPRHAGVCPYGKTFIDASFEGSSSQRYFPMAAPTCADSSCKERAIKPNGDECTLVPESNGSYYDFEVSCRMHDYGYDLIRVKQRWGYERVTKGEVDSEFLAAMQESCRPKQAMDRFYCNYIAWDYYLGVALFGNPDANSRPEGAWPEYDFLQNTSFAAGMKHWDALADNGERVAADTYNLGDGSRFIAFTCKDANGCRLKQDQPVSLWGGERLHTHLLVRCKPLGQQQPATCPLTFSVFGLRVSDNTWVELGPSVSADAPRIEEGSGWAVVGPTVDVPTGSGGGKLYKQIRFRIRNDSVNNRLDMIQPWITLGAS